MGNDVLLSNFPSTIFVGMLLVNTVVAALVHYAAYKCTPNVTWHLIFSGCCAVIQGSVNAWAFVEIWPGVQFFAPSIMPPYAVVLVGSVALTAMSHAIAVNAMALIAEYMDEPPPPPPDGRGATHAPAVHSPHAPPYAWGFVVYSNFLYTFGAN